MYTDRNTSAKHIVTFRFKLLTLIALVSIFLSGLSPSFIHGDKVSAQEPALQDGDLFVGAAQGVDGFGTPTGPAIMRIRNGAATVFCQPGPTYFYVPEQVMVDSLGRVVFLAYLGSPYFSRQGYGLFRCDTLGATPELLAVFPGGPGDTRMPQPYPNAVFESVGSLYLVPQKSIVIDNNVNQGLPQVVEDDVYGLVGALTDPNTGQRTGFKSMRYFSTARIWEDGPQPVQAYAHAVYTSLPDMIYHAGITYTVDDHQISRIEEPVRLNISGTIGNLVFGLDVSMFGGSKQIGDDCVSCATAQMITDDENIPNIDSGCNSHDNITDFVPLEPNGFFVPMSGFHNVVYDESSDLGMVITSDFGALTPYLTKVSEALLNDDPFDDEAQYFHHPGLGCAPFPSLHYKRILPFYSTDPATLDQSNSVGPGTGSLASTSAGLMGTGNGRIFKIMAGDHVQLINNTVLAPSGIGGYPSVVTSSSDVVLILQINSPVNVLVTDPNGKRVGDDPLSDQTVNDFAQNGFDSGQGEPRILAIKNPIPGAYSLHAIGTGNGPYAIHVYAVSLANSAGNHINVSGSTTVGTESDHDFTLAADTSMAFNNQAPTSDTTAPTIHVPASNIMQEATGNLTPVDYVITADDPDDSVASLSCTPASGTMFPLGDTTVNCTASDSNGNQSQASFHVIVQDTTAPVFVSPPTPVMNALINVNGTEPSGAMVSFDIKAVDLVDGNVATTCVPQSGNLFPINVPGEITTVICTASDNRTPPNIASITFYIHVKGALEQIGDLRTLIASYNLKLQVAKRLDRRLEQAQTAIEKNQKHRACELLEELLDENQKGLTLFETSEISLNIDRIRIVIGCDDHQTKSLDP